MLLVLVSVSAGVMLRAPLGAAFPWSQGFLVLAGLRKIPIGLDEV